ncbi:MAG: hypothetical protein QOH15_432, partial [Gaiellales bacterium]|nr:hypothetical protein [Gaiellales bacterium]
MHLGPHGQEDRTAHLEERQREQRLLVARPRQRNRHDGDDARGPLREHHDAICEADGLVDVMRHEQRTTGPLRERGLEPRLRVEASLRVERRQRLVEREHRTFGEQRPHEGDALTHATRERVRIVLGE